MGQEKHKAHVYTHKLAVSSGISGTQKVAATVGPRDFFFRGDKARGVFREQFFLNFFYFGKLIHTTFGHNF